MGAYTRLAAVKFREHKCEAETSLSAAKQETKRSVAASAFTERARVLIKRGYTPKVAVELALQETEVDTATIRGSWRRRVLMPRISF